MSDLGVDTEAVAQFFAQGGDEGEQFADEPDNTVDHSDVEQQEQNDSMPDPAEALGEVPDYSDLDPAQRAYLDKRIADYQRGFTAQTTKLADANRILQEAGGDPQAVLDAYEFAQALQNDPDVRERLYQALAAEAQQNAPTPQASEEQVDPFSEYDLPPEILNVLKAVPTLEARLSAYEQNVAEAEEYQAQQQYLQEVQQDLSAQYDDILEAYPDLQGEDKAEGAAIEAEIFALGAFTQGNLVQALDIYRSIESRGQAKLFKGSASVPGGSVAPPAGGSHSTEPPEVVENMRDLRGPVTEFLEQHMQ